MDQMSAPFGACTLLLNGRSSLPLGKPLNSSRSFFFKLAAAGTLATCALFAMTGANAQVNWSVGVNVPGVSIGVVEPGPLYYEPAPVYTRPAPPPAYFSYQPVAPVYDRPPVPVYVRPEPVYYGAPAYPDYRPGERRGHRHHHRRDWDERGDRD